MFKAEKAKNKPAGCTDAHGTDGYVSKSSPLIAFRGALDHAEAELILTQTLAEKEKALCEGAPARRYAQLIDDLQELLDLLRAVMSAEYRGTPLEDVKLFGYTLDELQERSHNATQYYGVPTMTRPSYEYGEIYARLNLVRTELRAVERKAVALLDNSTREDLLYILNRMSSADHVLMCRWLSEDLASKTKSV